MRKTVLQTIQHAMGEVKLPATQVAIGDNQPNTRFFVNAIRAACEDLMEDFDWNELTKPYSFTTVPGQSEYVLPADLLRILPNTVYDKTQQQEIVGAASNPQWAEMLGLDLGLTPGTYFHVQANKLILWPAPVSEVQVSYLYVSANYAINPSGTDNKAGFTEDADKYVFNDRLVTLACVLKYLEANKLDTAATLSDYNKALESAKGSNAVAPTRRMTRSLRAGSLLNVRDRNW